MPYRGRSLADAMLAALDNKGWMHVDDVAVEIARRDLWRRPSDGRHPEGWQVAWRGRKRPDWFVIHDNRVCLAN